MTAVVFCSRCLMPDTRPRVVFTDGVCNACLWAEGKKSIDWGARGAEFLRLFKHLVDALDTGVSGVCVSNIFHMTETALRAAKEHMRGAGCLVRL